jgi:hypothetical protein
VGRLSEHGFTPATLAALDQFIARAAEHELYQANPRHWAERLGLDEPTMLRLILVGVTKGFFNLNWQTTCPICKYYGRTAQSLGEIDQLHHCDQCDHDYEAHLDDEIFVTVSVNAMLRRLVTTQPVNDLSHCHNPNNLSYCLA